MAPPASDPAPGGGDVLAFALFSVASGALSSLTAAVLPLRVCSAALAAALAGGLLGALAASPVALGGAAALLAATAALWHPIA